MTTALLVVAILVLLIFVHEFGHFVAAKIFGVRVEEFGVGYPPRAFTFGRWGGTEYTLNWIPFGGFVRLFGDVGESEHGRGSFVDSPRWKQALVLFAGVGMNAIAAYLLFAAALHVGIPRVVQHVEPGGSARLIIADIVPGSPAASADISRGDEIIAVEDESGARVSKLTPATVSDFVRERGGKPVVLTYVHEGTTSSATLIPAHAIIPGEAGRPALGIAMVFVSIQSLPWSEASAEAFIMTKNAFVNVFSGLWSIVQKAFSGGSPLADVMGPVGLVGAVGAAAETGLGEVLRLAGFISVNLTIINLLPIPALDGGRLVILGAESIVRRRAPRLAIQLLNALGITIVIFLMIVVTYNDISRLLT